MHQHVPLGSLGSPGLPLSSYEHLHHRRLDPRWPSEPSRREPGPRRGLLRRVAQLVRLRPRAA